MRRYLFIPEYNTVFSRTTKSYLLKLIKYLKLSVVLLSFKFQHYLVDCLRLRKNTYLSKVNNKLQQQHNFHGI